MPSCPGTTLHMTYIWVWHVPFIERTYCNIFNQFWKGKCFFDPKFESWFFLLKNQIMIFFIEFSTTKLLQWSASLAPYIYYTFRNYLSAPFYYSLIECFPTVPRVWQWLWKSQHDNTKNKWNQNKHTTFLNSNIG